MPASLSDLYELIGGHEACNRLSEEFHERVRKDSVLSPIFPKNVDSLSQWFALFLGENLGGPASYTSKRGKQSLICRHAHLSISTEESARWLGHIRAAMDDAGIESSVAQRLHDFFVETAQTLTDPFLPLYQLPLEEFRQIIENAPELLAQSPAGHSLLREAVSRWDAPRVRMLLDTGADARTKENLGHGLLYRAANSEVPGSEAAGKQIVELLIRHGAEVNHQSGPGKSTPLHVTARRGHVFLANLLIGAGAEIEAQDSKGETPLRRAVNCRQEPMVRFLLSKGADPSRPDRQGRTPERAAQTASLRAAFANRR